MHAACPSPALTRTLNMEPPSGVQSSNPSNTPRRYNLNQGANFNISCTATHDDCSFTVDLYKDGTILRTGVFMDTELIKPRRSPCTMAEVYLVFQNFQPVHDGVYYCSASTNDRSQVLSDEWYLYGSGKMPTCECQQIYVYQTLSYIVATSSCIATIHLYFLMLCRDPSPDPCSNNSKAQCLL